MKYAISLAPFGKASDPRLLTELAREAEAAGWDGFFLWDHVNWSLAPGIADPWVALAGCAMTTSTITLGTLVTPLFRRRPVRLARETATLQHLCGGRLVLGVGLGSPDPQESTQVGEEPRLAVRARMTDEALSLVKQLWTGEPVKFQGQFFQVRMKGLRPVPTRIPIWVAATWPFRRGPLARAAACDGVVPARFDNRGLTPHDLRAVAQAVDSLRPAGKGDVVFGVATGQDPGRDRALVAAYGEAGVTWWLEPLNGWVAPFEAQRRRLRQGPPR